MMVLCFLSRALPRARHSPSPLGRQLCSASMNKPILTLFTKWKNRCRIEEAKGADPPLLISIELRFIDPKPCPLCDEAKEVLEPYKRRFILQEVDITLPENTAWYDKYKYDIPVFHLNGKFLMKHRVDIPKFEDRLRKLELRSDDGNQ